MLRWTGPFDTPNQAALVVALLGIACAALATASTSWPRVWRWTVLGVAIVGMVTVAILLAATRSRAGWLAYAGALGVMWLWRGTTLRWMAGAVGTLVVAIALWPGAMNRAGIAVQDAIAGERPALTAAALALIHDHPWRGLGSGFAGIYNQWYLPAALEGRYSTTLTDALTCAGQWGLPVLALALAVAATLIAWAWRVRGHVLVACAMGLTAVHLIAGLFQAHLWTMVPFMTASGSWLGLMTILVWRSCRQRTWLVDAGWALRRGVACGFGITLLTVVAASWAANRHPWRTVVSEGLVLAEPRHHPSGKLLVVAMDDQSMGKKIRRGLAARAGEDGWAVVIGINADPADPVSLVRHVARVHRQPALFCAYHQSAVHAWASAQHGDLDMPMVLINPHGLPAPGADDRASPPILVHVTRYAPFVPDRAGIEAALIPAPAPSRVQSWPLSSDPPSMWTSTRRWFEELL